MSETTDDPIAWLGGTLAGLGPIVACQVCHHIHQFGGDLHFTPETVKHDDGHAYLDCVLDCPCGQKVPLFRIVLDDESDAGRLLARGGE